jgi:prephenate dehydrogenase
VNDTPRFRRVAIVGLGLVGGSLALALRSARSSTLVGIDPDEGVLREAVRRGIVDAASTDVASAIGADLVVLAAPVRANLRVLSTLAVQPEGAIITDVGSTKRAIVQAARSLGCSGRFVGGHPLAGAACGGLVNASADLFEGRRWLFTPDGNVSSAALAELERLVAAVGAIPVRMTAEEHDLVMAHVSHLPQLVASAVMHVVGRTAREEGMALAGAGLVDTTRLASSPPEIWRDICSTNADNLGTALQALVETLQALHADLAKGDRLEDVFASAQEWRLRLIRNRRGPDPERCGS